MIRYDTKTYANYHEPGGIPMSKNKSKSKKKQNGNYLSGVYSPKRRALITRSPEDLTIGQRLRRERYLRRLSQEQLAAELGISVSYYGALERGERTLSAAIEKKLHDHLHISYDYLHLGITVSGEAISQYVHESARHSTRHNIDVLLGICTPDELENCYELIHTYLISRHRRKSVYDSHDSKNFDEHTLMTGLPRETAPLPDSVLPGSSEKDGRSRGSSLPGRGISADPAEEA